MRVGGPADLFAEVHNLFELRAIVRFARVARDPAVPPRAAARTWSSAMRAWPAWWCSTGRRAAARRGHALHRRLRAADGQGGDASPRTPGSRASSSGWPSRARSAAPCGPTPVPTSRTWRRCWWRRASSARDGTRRPSPPTGSASPTATASSRPRADGVPEVVTWATFELEPASPEVIAGRLDEIRRWRQAHQPLGLPSAGSVFRNPDGDSAGRIIDELGLKGRRIGGAGRQRAARQLHRQRRRAARAADVRRLAEEVPATVLRERGIELRFEIVFAGDWSGWSRRLVSLRRAAAAPSRSCSAGHRRSTTSRSSRAARSPRALAEPAGTRWQGWLIDLDGRWWRLPAAAMDRTLPQTAYDDPRALGAEGPLTRRPAAAGTPRRQRPATGRVPGAARAVRRGRHAPGAARIDRAGVLRLAVRRPPRSAWTRPSSSACAAPWACRSCPGSRCAPPTSTPRPGGHAAAGRGLRGRPARPAPGDQARPARLQHRGRHRRVARLTARARARHGRRLPPTTTCCWPRPTCQGARELEVERDRQRARPAIEVFGPGEIIPGASSTTSWPSTVRTRSRTLTAPEPPLDPDLRERARPRARGLPGHRRGRLRAGRLPARRRRRAVRLGDQHDPGLHADQPVPGALRGGRLQLSADLRAHRGAGRLSVPAGGPRRRLTRADLP